MSDDHLSNETSISAELTETGVKAAARSRAVSAVDRLVGNVADLGNAWLEGISGRRRAKTEGERQLIEAAAKQGVERMSVDQEFANRVLENHFKKIAQQQINKDAVVAEAMEDLRQKPPSDEESLTGPETVGDEFLDRFERYVEGATTEELRARWGKILASEIRKPGTFSSRVLRATDELDGETALLFENMMQYRVGKVLVKCIMPKTPFDSLIALSSAGLIVEPGFPGHMFTFGEGRFVGQPESWITKMGQLLVCFPKTTPIPVVASDILARGGEGPTENPSPSFGAYILTDIGIALSSILPSNETEVGIQYARKLRSLLGDKGVFTMAEIGSSKFMPVAI